jgi:ferritin-like metal-binding protein YciE
MQLNTLKDVYVHQLQDLMSAENQILEALPKLIRAAKESALKQALKEHQSRTEEHVGRLQALLEEMGEGRGRMKCKGMEGLLKEGAEIIEAEGTATAKDVALISAAQRVEHYEISAYGSARAYAEELGMTKAVDVLSQTLKDESEANDVLDRIALGSPMASGLNIQAAGNGRKGS